MSNAPMTDDDKVLAELMRRVFDELHWVDYRRGALVLDGRIAITDAEWAVVKRVWEGE